MISAKKEINLQEYNKDKVYLDIADYFDKCNCKKDVWYKMLLDNLKTSTMCIKVSQIFSEIGITINSGFEIHNTGAIDILEVHAENESPHIWDINIDRIMTEPHRIEDYNFYDFLKDDDLVVNDLGILYKVIYFKKRNLERLISIKDGDVGYKICCLIYDETAKNKNFITTFITYKFNKIDDIMSIIHITKTSNLHDIISRLPVEDKMILNIKGLIPDNYLY